MARAERGADGDGSALVLDLAGLPTTWRTSQARWMPWLWGSFALLAALQLVLVLLGSVETGAARVGVQAAQLVAGVGAALWSAHLAVWLEPTGYRIASTRWGRGVRPWSHVAEVRPPSRWLRFAELRGTRGSDVPVALVGMTAEQAVELQRRLVEARARAEQAS